MGRLSHHYIDNGDAEFHPSVLGIVTKWEGKMVLRSALMDVHITVRTMPLYCKTKKGHGQLAVTLTSLGKM